MPEKKSKDKNQAQRIIEGLQIILKYDSSGNIWHDITEYTLPMHAGSHFDAKNASPEDNEKLRELGWNVHYNGGWKFLTVT